MDVEGFLAKVRGREWYKDQVADDRIVPAREAVVREPEAQLHPVLVQRLVELGRWPLYSHQADAIDAALGGENVIVSTATASGKTICFQAPVLHDWLQDRGSRALFLYPTKALTQDQLGSLRNLASFGASPKAAIYDGDTPQEERSSSRRSAHVLMTNPDMLHVGILPNHKLWSNFLQRLTTVVIDEAHYYRGVFGSHTALVMRRLRRLCKRYGAEPRFILCSATIGNPAELAENLTGLPFRAVTESGAPRGEKRFLLWNPPLLPTDKSAPREKDDADGAGRVTAQSESAKLLAEAVQEKVQTVAFVRTRRLAEIVFIAARDQVGRNDARLAQRLAPYRGTYLPEQRRLVERELRDGKLLGVAATNALELGMDIGGLDATVLTGYPGSIASAWQQAGRGGRRGEASLAVLVARDDPLDQYLMHHPEFFHGRPMEHALVAPENPNILSEHLLCAAHEAPLTMGDEASFGPTLRERMNDLTADGQLREGRGRWHLHPSIDYPAQHVQLRSTSDRMYKVVDHDSGAMLEQGIDESSAFSQLHRGAIYLHQGAGYIVEDLDLKAETAVVRQTRTSYYTVARNTTDIHLVEDLASRYVSAGIHVALSLVDVTRHVVSYQKIAYRNEQSIGVEDLVLPAQRFRTVALRFEAPPVAVEDILSGKRDLAGGLHAAEHAAIGVLPLFALCDRADIGGVSTPMHPDTGVPTVFIYDGYPGGIGIAERGYEAIEALWRTTLQAIAECPCSEGCPGCIQSPKCGNNNHPLDKAVAAELLRGLLNLRS